MTEKKRILFICTGNSCRSQMAEGWARSLRGGEIEAYSAGVSPLEGFRLAASNLTVSVKQPRNIEARSAMMMSSMMGAIAFQKGLGLTHSCAHADPDQYTFTWRPSH